MRDSAENILAIFIRGGEPWLMRYCWLSLSGTLSQQTLFLHYATKILSVVEKR
jgi:hypothetical protein